GGDASGTGLWREGKGNGSDAPAHPRRNRATGETTRRVAGSAPRGSRKGSRAGHRVEAVTGGGARRPRGHICSYWHASVSRPFRSLSPWSANTKVRDEHRS